MNYGEPHCYDKRVNLFMGTVLFTTNRLDNYRTLVQVEVNWNEPLFGASMARREYCANRNIERTIGELT